MTASGQGPNDFIQRKLAVPGRAILGRPRPSASPPPRRQVPWRAIGNKATFRLQIRGGENRPPPPPPGHRPPPPHSSVSGGQSFHCSAAWLPSQQLFPGLQRRPALTGRALVLGVPCWASPWLKLQGKWQRDWAAIDNLPGVGGAEAPTAQAHKVSSALFKTIAAK